MLRNSLLTIHKQIRSIVQLNKRKIIRFAPVFIGLTTCDNSTNSFKLDDLDHEFLIKQASTVNINAASQFLTVTMAAIEETSQKLRDYLVQEMNLYKQAQDLGLATLAPSHWDTLISIRSTIDDLKHNLLALYSYLEYAEKLATTAAEVSYLSGNISASDAMCQRIQQANSFCETKKSELATLQHECLELHKTLIESSPQLEEILNVPNVPEEILGKQ